MSLQRLSGMIIITLQKKKQGEEVPAKSSCRKDVGTVGDKTRRILGEAITCHYQVKQIKIKTSLKCKHQFKSLTKRLKKN